MHEGTAGDGFDLVEVQVKLLQVEHTLEVVLEDGGDVIVSQVEIAQAGDAPERMHPDCRDERVGDVQLLNVLELLEDRSDGQVVFFVFGWSNFEHLGAGVHLPRRDRVGHAPASAEHLISSSLIQSTLTHVRAHDTEAGTKQVQQYQQVEQHSRVLKQKKIVVVD